ncbi:LPXTG cell wall anchor domain-containing protein [Microbacterium sp. 2P01SA-2]
MFLDLTVVEGLAASGGDDAAWFALGGAGALLLGAGVTIAMRRRRAAVQG